MFKKLMMGLGLTVMSAGAASVASARQPDATQTVSVRALALQVEADAKSMLAAAEMSRGVETRIDGRVVGSYRWLATSAEKFRESLSEADYRELDRAFDETYPTLSLIPQNPLSVTVRDRLVTSVQSLDRYFADPAPAAPTSVPYEHDRSWERRTSFDRPSAYPTAHTHGYEGFAPSSVRLAAELERASERTVQLARTELSPPAYRRGMFRRAYRADVRQTALEDLMEVSAAANALTRAMSMGGRGDAEARRFEDLLRAHNHALRAVGVFSGNVRAAFEEVSAQMSELRRCFHQREGEIAIRW